MLQKITLGIAILAVLLGVIALIPHISNSPSLGYSGAAGTQNSIQLTPTSSAGDLYSLGWGQFSNRYSSASATTLIDLYGYYVGAVNDGIAALTISTSTPTSTLTAAQICNNGILQIPLQNISSITTGTITFAASSTINTGCLGRPGSSHMLTIQNIGTSTSTVTFVAGSGNQLMKPFTGSSTLTIVGGQQAFVNIVNANGTDTIEFIQSF